MSINTLYVVKRDGRREEMNLDKIDSRLNFLARYPTRLSINASFVSEKVRAELHDGIGTRQLDEIAERVAKDMASHNPDYEILATRIAVNNHHKNTADCFSDTVEACYRNRKMNGKPAPRINKLLYKFVQIHKATLNRIVDYRRDYTCTYFAFSTLVHRYLIKRSGSRHLLESRPQDYALERVQDMYMRCACAIHMNRLQLDDPRVLADVEQTYNCLSTGTEMLATPALFNLGTNIENAISCFILTGDDSIESIAKIKGDAMKISKTAGGIGLSWNLRADGVEVASTNGMSRGPIPFLKAFESDMLSVDQGGKRPGSAAHYLSPAHPDFMRWARLKRTDNEERIPKLNFAVWAPDEFMRRVERNDMWYFVDPHECPELYRLWGDAYTAEYERIIQNKLYMGEPVPARAVLEEICRSEAETGQPYMMYSCAVNRKSNQQNLGFINASNLCTEICEFSSSSEYANCCLSTVCEPKFVVPCVCATRPDACGPTYDCNGTWRIDYLGVAAAAGRRCVDLNKIIDFNYYPVPEAQRSNLAHRPLAIGCQGHADVVALMRLGFTSAKARAINRKLAEAIYYGALRASCDLAKRDGPYSSFAGSPFSRGVLQFDMYDDFDPETMLSGLFPWDELKRDIVRYGTRNSQLTSYPPTASTSHIQGNNECFEPFVSNIYVRETMSGDFVVINRHLVRDLREEGLWTPENREQLIRDRGSVQQLPVPDWMKEVYKTVWEMDTRALIDMDRDRQYFCDQSMSSNRWIKRPTLKKMFAMHMRAWRAGLKTGMYYLHSQSLSKAKHFSEKVAPATVAAVETNNTVEVDVRDMVEQSLRDNDDRDNSNNGDDDGDGNIGLSELEVCRMFKVDGVTCYSCV